MKRRTRCFLLLSVLIFGLTGCIKVAEFDGLLTKMTDAAEDGCAVMVDIITLSGVENTAKSVEVEYCFASPYHSTYAYDSLNETEKLWYDDINHMLAARSEKATALSKEGFAKGLDEKSIDKIYQCVMIDHPEYFFVEGYEYTTYSSRGKLLGIEVKGTYDLSLEECLKRKEQIDAVVQTLLENAPANGTDYDKIEYVYESVIYNTEYCMDAEDNQNIYSVFVGQASVCQGYAKATQYLLNCLGVGCTLVYGNVNGTEGHSWNLVLVEDAYYYLDTTWGDASYLADTEIVSNQSAPEINYDYLCITTDQLLKTHTIEHDIEVPVCETTAYNYYRMEGCYFEDYNEAQVSREFQEAAGNKCVTLKCSDAKVYETMRYKLIEQQEVFAYLKEDFDSVAYIENEQQLSLTFWMTN